MRRFALVLAVSCLSLVACVDTTGLSASSSRTPRGNPQSEVTVTEYGDLQCPACKTAHETINVPLLQKYGKQVRFEFKHFPLRNIHPYAFEAAQASECAADQGKFWEFLDLDYQYQAQLSSDALREWAAQLGLNADLFDRCVRSGIKEKTVTADFDEGRNLNVQGTPTYFVNGKKIEVTGLDNISTAIDAALKQRAPPL